MSVIKVTSDNFDEVVGSGRPVVLKFFAEWCGPCAALSPVIEGLAKSSTDVIFAESDIDADTLYSSFGVRSVPSLVFFDELGNQVGDPEVGTATTEEINFELKKRFSNA